MEKKLLMLVITGIFVFSSCEKQESESDFIGSSEKKSTQTELNGQGNANGQNVLNFRTHLSGDQEVPPRETLGTGEVQFQLSKDGLELRYKIIVANLDNISMSHIHVAPAGSNGGIVVWLYPPAPPAALIPGTTNGILQQGVITKANLTGTLGGQELSALIDLMVADQTYVNVHTSQFQGGEIRGQVFGNVKAE